LWNIGEHQPPEVHPTNAFPLQAPEKGSWCGEEIDRVYLKDKDTIFPFPLQMYHFRSTYVQLGIIY
jgi:hypothetical protein